MSLPSYLLGIVAALLVLVVVVELLRRGRLRERHAVWWILAGLLALVAAVFPTTLTWAADLLGVQVPTNLVFFAGIAVLFFVALQSSSELTNLETRVRTLAEQNALHELRIRQLESQQLESQRGDRVPPEAEPGEDGR